MATIIIVIHNILTCVQIKYLHVRQVLTILLMKQLSSVSIKHSLVYQSSTHVYQSSTHMYVDQVFIDEATLVCIHQVLTCISIKYSRLSIKYLHVR